MAVFENVQNIFLVYPAFCGGNHLINLLSLSEKIEPSFLSPKELKFRYQELNRQIDIDTPKEYRIAHFNEPERFSNSGRVIEPTLLDDMLTQQKEGYINVVQGHLNNWLELMINHRTKLEQLKSPIWMFMSWPKEELALTRLRNAPHALEKEIEFNYPSVDETEDIPIWKLGSDAWNFDTVSGSTKKLFNVQPSSRIMIDTDEFFKESGFNYFHALVKGYLGIELPYDMGLSIHKLWRELIGID